MTKGLATYFSEARLRAWNDAIYERYSVRSYRKRPVRKEALKSIEELLRGFSPLCSHARGYLVAQDASRLFTGVVGSFGKVSRAPSAIAFAGEVHLQVYGSGRLLGRRDNPGSNHPWPGHLLDNRGLQQGTNSRPIKTCSRVEGNRRNAAGVRGEKPDAGRYGAEGSRKVGFPEAAI